MLDARVNAELYAETRDKASAPTPERLMLLELEWICDLPDICHSAGRLAKRLACEGLA